MSLHEKKTKRKHKFIILHFWFLFVFLFIPSKLLTISLDNFKKNTYSKIFYIKMIFRSARTIHSKWTRHQAFQSEIQSNKERLDQVRESGSALIQAKPEMADLVQPRLEEIQAQFTKLEVSLNWLGL